jgi:peptide/nickel transport system ATP-binding protein
VTHPDATSLGPTPVLSLVAVSIAFTAPAGLMLVADSIGLSIAPGETLGLVGESGCGKSVTALAIMGLLPAAIARVSGRILFEGVDLLRLSRRALRRLRGRRIGMIFQEPMSALDPVFTVGEQIAETIRAHERITRRAAHERAIAALAEVGIAEARRRAGDYPHHLSGGMRQRVMIAIAMACRPSLLIADEPTTALDVTIQAQILDLLLESSRRTGSALLIITHDIGVIAQTCSRMLTMYAGQVVEDASVEQVLRRPLHPYTSGLLRSLPGLSPPKSLLPSIAGVVPSPDAMPAGCRFAARCNYAEPGCEAPQQITMLGDRGARCRRQAELELPGSLA